jgi:predicted nucleotidyltransferase
MLSKNKIIKEPVLNVLSYLRGKNSSIREIAQKTALSYNTCYKTVQDLAASKVLSLQKKGNVVFCSLRPGQLTSLLLSLVSYREATVFFRKNIIIQKMIDELLAEKKKDIMCLAIFGSYARGTARKQSDVDMFVVGKPVEKYVQQLAMKYALDIHLVTATPKEFTVMMRGEGVTVGKEVVSSGIVLYGFEKYWELVL